MITDSYLVTSRYDRQYVSELLTRTGLTQREYDNLSAEWFGHNVAYVFRLPMGQRPIQILNLTGILVGG